MPNEQPLTRRQRAYIASITVLTVLPSLFVFARIGAKRMRHNGWTLDDTLLVGALFFLYICSIGAFLCALHGVAGRHLPTVSPDRVKQTLMLLWAFQYAQSVALTLARCSMSILLLRLFFTKMFPKLRFAAFATIVLSVAYLFASFLIYILHCRPLKYNWTLPVESPDHCFPLRPAALTMTSFGLFLDALIWSLPHFVVWKLQLRLAHKIAISAIFALGTLNIIIGACRISTLDAITFQGDLTYDISTAIVWAVARVSTAIMVVCCPLLRPIFEKCVPKRLTRIVTSRPPRRPEPIQVTTKIVVHPDTSEPRKTTFLQDGMYGPEGPTFHVERRQSISSRRLSLCGTALG